MRKILGILSILCGLLPARLAAESAVLCFEITCANIRSGDDNTLLLLKFDPARMAVFKGSTNAKVSISVEDPTTHAPVLRKQYRERFRARPDENVIREYAFSLPPGSYFVAVEVVAGPGWRPQLRTADYQCTDFSEAWALSDILLFEGGGGGPFIAPIIGGKLPSGARQLRFRSDVTAREAKVLTARALLFRKAEKSGDLRAEQFVSLAQINEILKIENDGAVFSGTFDVADLPAGEYLVEVYLYRDEEMKAEENTPFRVEWKPVQGLLEDLDASIRKMVYAAVPATIDSLLTVANPVEKRRQFLEFWRRRSGSGESNTTEALRAYYSRINDASLKFTGEAEPGWKTERGKIFFQYGAPDHRSSYTKDNKSLEIWVYNRWNLKFLFLKTGNKYQLMTPEKMRSM